MRVIFGLGLVVVAAGVAGVSAVGGAEAARGSGAVEHEHVFEEVDGLVAVEAEHYVSQALTEVRQWYLVTEEHTPEVEPREAGNHAATASGGAYMEILPDTRMSHDDELIRGENFSNQPGVLAVISYKVQFNTPGRYYVWARVYSTNTEDNGVHVGINGTWPASGQRMQWCRGKHTWRWESRQRTRDEHCGERYLLYLDVDEPGLHEISFSMREDGFRMDKWLMALDRDFEPEGAGPAERRWSGGR